VEGASAAATPAETKPAAPSGVRLGGGSPAAAPAAPSAMRTGDASAGTFGVAYTVGRERPITLTLNRAEYSVLPVRTGDELAIPLASEKLLVVHVTLKNPNSEEIVVSGGVLTFVTLGPEGSTSERQDWLISEKTGEYLDTTLGPNKTLDAFAVITLPAKGGIDKLVVGGDGGSSVEIGIGPSVKPLPAVAADPSDRSGHSALAEVPVPMDATCQLGIFNVLVEKAQYSANPILKQSPGKGAQFLAAALIIMNATPREQPIHWGSFAFSLKLADGREVSWNEELLLSNKDELIDQTLGPGKQLRARIFFEVPAGAEADVLRAREGKEGREYLVKLEVAK